MPGREPSPRRVRRIRLGVLVYVPPTHRPRRLEVLPLARERMAQAVQVARRCGLDRIRPKPNGAEIPLYYYYRKPLEERPIA
jgi:hypothetical protein